MQNLNYCIIQNLDLRFLNNEKLTGVVLMKKVFRNLCCMTIVLSLCLSLCIVPGVSAAGEYIVSANYDSSLGSVQLTNLTAETAALSADEMWYAENTLAANERVEIIDGIFVTPVEDFNSGSLSNAVNIDGYSFRNYVAGSNNGEVSADSVTGAVFKVDAERSGTLAFALTLGDGKGARACRAETPDDLILDYKNNTGASVNDFFEFDVAEGQSYYFWGVGTRARTFGAVFSEKTTVTASAGDVIKITSTPDSSALLGNVSLSDASLELVKNEDMTECTFTMPAHDVGVDVAFVSSSFEDEIRQISFDEIKGANVSESEVDSDLALFDGWVTAIGYADVSWMSSDESAITASGIVNSSSEAKSVTLTAVFTYQDYPNITAYREFNLTVSADTDDAAAVAAAKESLTLGDTSAVRDNITLPASGRKNTTITWESSDETVVANDGTVTRYPEADRDVVLTATISRGAVSDTKEFRVTVIGYLAVEISRVAVSNADGDVVLSPVDGGYVSHIVYTSHIPNPTGSERLIVAVYDEEDSGRLISSGIYSISENTDEETVLRLGSGEVQTTGSCTIKVFAFDGTDTISPMMSEPYIYTNTIADSMTVYVAGDSTACTYPATGRNNRFPQTGWAAVLQDYFSSDVTVSDLARSGRSSLSFRSENNYQTIVNNIKAGDYFIIQFGHNDDKPGETDRYTNPVGDRFTEGTFKNSLMNYINAALDKGAQPILTTPICRRRDNNSSLEAYAAAMRELGRELGLPVMDLFEKTGEYISSVGLEKAKDIYLHTYPGDSRFTGLSAGDYELSQNYSSAMADDTHINYYGAQMIAQWFCDELQRLGHPLTEKRSSHTTTLDDIPSYADAVSTI